MGESDLVRHHGAFRGGNLAFTTVPSSLRIRYRDNMTADGVASTEVATAVERTRWMTLVSVLGTVLALVATVTKFAIPGVALILAIGGLMTALQARRSGIGQGAPFDGRLSMVSAIVAVPLIVHNLIGLSGWVFLLVGSAKA